MAAEASSAHYAMSLLSEWKKQNKEIYFFGVGTLEMEKNGFDRVGKAEEMAVVGLVEVIKHFSRLKLVFNELLEKVKIERPQFVILMDYPDFNLRLAEQIKKIGIPVFYYISPQVWAWRQNRIHDIKACCDHVFLLFPFEKIFYDHFQVPNTFVGHPLLEDLKPELTDSNNILQLRQKYGIKKSEQVLALMPGSRFGEIEKIFPTQLTTASILLKQNSQLRLVIFTAPTLQKEDLKKYLENYHYPFILIKDEPRYMIPIADVVLVASGTATLLVGLLQKPMVIMYKVSWLTGIIGGFLTRHLKYFGLVNLILDENVVPEVKQSEAEPKNLARLLELYIKNDEYRNSTIAKLKNLKNKLGYDSNDSLNATQKVIQYLNRYF